MKLPKRLQEVILHIDATPNVDYPLRILRAHRKNCNYRWKSNSPSAVIDAINEDRDKRAILLDIAILCLEKNKKENIVRIVGDNKQFKNTLNGVKNKLKDFNIKIKTKMKALNDKEK